MTIEFIPMVIFSEKKVGKRKINSAAVADYGVDVADMENLKQGKDIQLANGDWVENHRLTFDPAPPKSMPFAVIQHLNQIWLP